VVEVLVEVVVVPIQFVVSFTEALLTTKEVEQIQGVVII
jgi:hypothetical protein